MTLAEVEAQLHQVQQRRAYLEFLSSWLEKLDAKEESVESFPASPPPQLENVSERSFERSFVSRRPRPPSPVRFSFTPQISENSRRIAQQLPRNKLYEKSAPVRSAAALVESANPASAAASRNPVTEAILAKIVKKYGSLEAYHQARKAKQVSWKELLEQHAAKEMHECTFQPAVGPSIGGKSDDLKSEAIQVSGTDQFVLRQQKARQLKLGLDKPPPGYGHYTGKPTKPVPFSFLKTRE